MFKTVFQIILDCFKSVRDVSRKDTPADERRLFIILFAMTLTVIGFGVWLGIQIF